jgi:hypothetical protein
MTQRTTIQPRIQLQLWLIGMIVSGSLFLTCLSPAIAFAGAFRILRSECLSDGTRRRLCSTGR